MAKIEISVPGERILEEFTALVPQPTVPSTARAPDVGLVELTYMNPTELVPGPPGPPGPRGSRWTTGVGAPVTPGGVLGDQYLDSVTGIVWSWDGTQWVQSSVDLTGPQGSPDTPAQVLAKIITVDGTGSSLDADLLDGHDTPYFLDYNNQTNKPSSYPPTLPIPESGVTNLVADLALKAPLASPTFTGDPKAPTPAVNDNDTSVSTTAFVTTAVANGVANRLTDAPSDGLTYGRKNATWSTIIGGAVVSDTAPAGPLQNGQLWFKSDEGNTYIWYSDPNSSQWTQVNVLPATAQFPVATAQTRNRIVNPAFQIAQEQTSTTASGQYFADQWLAGFTGGGTATYTQLIPSPTDGNPRNQGRLVVGTADTSIAAGDYLVVMSYLEGTRLNGFNWGTAAALPAVLRFRAIGTSVASMGTYYVSLRSSNADVSFVAPFTLTTSWQDFTIPIAPCTTGTWTYDNSKGATLTFAFAGGATNQTPTPNSWVSGSFFAGTSISNGWGTAGNDFRIANVGLYLDPQNTGVAPAWQMPDEAEELRACQRYYYKTPGVAWFIISGIATAASQSAYSHTPFPVQMRITPSAGTVTFIASAYSNAANLIYGAGYVNGFRASVSSSAAGVFYALTGYEVNARM